MSDLDATWKRIARDSTHYARRTIARILEAAESLAELAERGRRVPEARHESIRELLLGNYRLIYRAAGLTARKAGLPGLLIQG